MKERPALPKGHYWFDLPFIEQMEIRADLEDDERLNEELKKINKILEKEFL